MSLALYFFLSPNRGIDPRRGVKSHKRVMTDFSLIPSSPLSAELEMYPIYGDTLDYYEQDYNVTPYLIFPTDLTGLLSDIDLTDDSSWFYVTDSVLVVVNVIIILVCMFGLVGNGVVIWLLGFRMKRTPFTT